MCSSKSHHLGRAYLMPSSLAAAVILMANLPFALAQPDTRFVVTGDSRGSYNGINAPILAEIAAAIVAEDVEFVLFAGDLVNGSSDSATLQSQLLAWRDTMQVVYDAGIVVYPCRGNHDTGNRGAWDQVFSGPYALPTSGPAGEENITFSATHGTAFIIGLDQYVTFHRVNQTWLDEQFSVNEQPHVFVFGHVPAFSVDHHDCLDDYPSERNDFWNSLAIEGARVYFTGHDHFYNRAWIDDGDGDATNDLQQYLVGTAGAPLRSWDGLYNGNNGDWMPILVYHESQYGYLLVEITGDEVSMTWKHRTAPGVYQPVAEYLCGDADRNDIVNISDAVALISYIFGGGAIPAPLEAGDVDCNHLVNAGDAVYLITFIFGGGPAPCAACP